MRSGKNDCCGFLIWHLITRFLLFILPLSLHNAQNPASLRREKSQFLRSLLWTSQRSPGHSQADLCPAWGCNSKFWDKRLRGWKWQQVLLYGVRTQPNL